MSAASQYSERRREIEEHFAKMTLVDGSTQVHLSPSRDYEMVFFDFTNPTQSPLPELARFQDLDTADGWIGPGEFSFSVGEGEQRQLKSWKR